MHKRGLLLVTSTAIISGFSIFLNKYAVSGIDSSIFTFLKNVLVAAVLISVLLLWKRKAFSSLSRKQWLLLAVVGLIGGSIPFLLYFRGLQIVSGSMGAFIHKTMFIYVAFLAAYFLKEKLRKPMFVAGIALLAGNFLLLRMNNMSFGLGEILVLTATILWAFENVLSKHLLKDMEGTAVAAGRMGFGALFILLFLLFTGKTELMFSLTKDMILWIFFTSLFLLAYLVTWYNGLKYIDVSTATNILLIGSPITTLLSFTFSSASIELSQFLGIILIVSGVLTAIYSKRLSNDIGQRSILRS